MIRRLLPAALVATISSSAIAQSPTVTLLGYRTTVPAAWSSRAPASTMRLAEFTTPATGSAAGAEVVVYFFGKTQGGTVQANTDRWKAQFSNPDGSPIKEKVTRDSAGALSLTFAEYHGTYARGIGAGSSAGQAKPGQELIAAIVETPNGTMYVQLFGPEASVNAQRDALTAFVKGLKP